MSDIKILSDIEKIPANELIDFETITRLANHILKSPRFEVESVITQFAESRPLSDIGSLLYTVGSLSEDGRERHPDHGKWFDYVNQLVINANQAVRTAFLDPISQETLQQFTDELSKGMLHEQHVIMRLKGNQKSALQFDLALIQMAINAYTENDLDAFNYFWGVRQRILTWCF